MAHEATAPERVRNVVLVGHTGGGKTTLVEAVLAATGAVSRPGSVQDGTTVTDFDEQARKQHRSVSVAVASCEHAGIKLNLIDTPGHPDYVGELRAGLRGADAALFVVSAVDGLDGATALLWDECASIGMPRAVVVTKLDQPRADFEESVAVCQRVFGEGVVPLYLPLHDEGRGGADDAVVGLIGLLSLQLYDYSGRTKPQTRDADPEHRELVDARRSDLIEAIIQESEDDALMDRYLAGEEVGLEILVPDLERAVSRGSFFPVLPVVAQSGVGIHELLEILTEGFPSPLEHPLPAVTTPDGDPRGPISCDPNGPLVAEVIKTTTDPYVGRVSLVRVFSGTLHPDSAVHVSGHSERFAGMTLENHEDHDVDEKVGVLTSPLGATLRPTGRCIAGDICTVARLTRAETSDTLSDVGDPLLVEPWLLPEPLLPVAIRAASPSDEEKMAESLTRLTIEDATVRIEHDARTQQLVLWAMGEAHVALVLDRLKDRYGVQVEAIAHRVSLRETFQSASSGRGRLVKQSGGHGQFAVCEIEVEPLPAGTGLEFVDKVVGGSVPRQYISSVEKGIRARAERGLMAGYPLTDVKVTLTGGKAHSVDSSDAAFAQAGGMALEDAASTGLRLLEPVDEVEITVDDEYVGAVMTDLSSRRGRVTGTEPLGNGRSRVRADVPATSLARYAIELRSVAHGTGVFTRAYVRHDSVPANVAERILAETADAPVQSSSHG
ncbi:elongation factor G-like protein EF-G2 [Angustibacter sp. McL0619]|uniref:elongation factor G-like protein EF-G2 n=1 Tax=Angustibacter sp. McL0619 TaxID=3415676 RepID=UPI003CF84BC7